MKYTFSDKISNLKPSAIREILKMTSDPNIISFAAGNPAPDAFPVEEIYWKRTPSQLSSTALPRAMLPCVMQ